MEEAAKTAKTSAETVSKGGEIFGKTGAFKAISQVCTRFKSRDCCYVLSKLFIVLCFFKWDSYNTMDKCVLVMEVFLLCSGCGECKERNRGPGTHRSLSASCQTQKEERVFL